MELRRGVLSGFDGKDWVDCTNLLYTENEINTVTKLADTISVDKYYNITWVFGTIKLVYNGSGYSIMSSPIGCDLDIFEKSYTRMQLMKARLGL
jgi:hypothetical protein